MAGSPTGVVVGRAAKAVPGWAADPARGIPAPDRFPARYQVEVSSAANFLLGLSDVLSRRFGRTVHDRAPKLTRKVTVPSSARFRVLDMRVTVFPLL
jgi:hypothetical protein